MVLFSYYIKCLTHIDIHSYYYHYLFDFASVILSNMIDKNKYYGHIANYLLIITCYSLYVTNKPSLTSYAKRNPIFDHTFSVIKMNRLLIRKFRIPKENPSK